jgi:transcriptional regulator with XRE-family HTH domain
LEDEAAAHHPVRGLEMTRKMNQRASDYIRKMRQVVAEHVDNTSLRKVARQLGMSPAGLRQFLDGAAPYTPTLRRLRRWYPRYAAQAAGNVDPRDAATALTLLLHEFAPDPRGEVAAEILDTLAGAYEASGKTRPEWIGELRGQYAHH